MRLLIFIFCLFITIHICNSCHYSCNQCYSNYYTQCIKCSNRQHKLFPLTKIDNKTLGICAQNQYRGVNGLGIVLLIIAIISAIVFRSSHLLYFILAFQSLGLLFLIESALTQGLVVILGAFQYFMIFSIMQQNSKLSDGYYLNRHMYRLNQFLQSINFSTNIPPIIAINIVLFALLITVTLFQAFRGFSCKNIKNEQIQTVLIALRTYLLMTLQETLLIIYAAIRFSPLTPGLQFLILLYAIMVVFLIVNTNMHVLPYFGTPSLMNFNFLKRLLLPVLVIIPYKFTYILIIFMIGATTIQLILLTKSKVKIQRYIYQSTQLISQLLFGGYLIAQLSANNQLLSYKISIVCIIIFTIFIVLFIIEIIMLLRAKFYTKQIQNIYNWDKNNQGSDQISRLHTMAEINPIQQNQSGKIQSQGLKTDKKHSTIFETIHRPQKKFKVSKQK